MRNKLSKNKILFIAILFFGCMSIISIMHRPKPFQTDGVYNSPQEAFQAAFSNPPAAVFPCEGHMHLVGRVARETDEEKNYLISAVATQTELGWQITETIQNTPILRLNNDPYGTHWSNLVFFAESKCRKRMMEMMLIIPGEVDEAGADALLQKVTDTAGTEFVIRGGYRPAVQQSMFEVFGIPDIRQEGYTLFFDGNRIYP